MKVDIDYKDLNSEILIMREEIVYYLKYTTEKCTSTIQIGSGKYKNAKMVILKPSNTLDMSYFYGPSVNIKFFECLSMTEIDISIPKLEGLSELLEGCYYESESLQQYT
ncbi:hypothetical protein RF11_14972 [Thelohanellus kitauei]|uniref:Uncharacterized protein n=1 Tax=Thelohanellus kitauei TaxID=669202 RepID=A0A0C2J7J6_THEKT|nr:hypothetical protein RF11_14972 [Thelohanellus kitauei]